MLQSYAACFGLERTEDNAMCHARVMKLRPIALGPVPESFRTMVSCHEGHQGMDLGTLRHVFGI